MEAHLIDKMNEKCMESKMERDEKKKYPIFTSRKEYDLKQYVTIDKRSKKAQKEHYASMRQTWGGLNPVTRTMPNGKAYNRKKDKAERRRTDSAIRDGYAVGSLLLSVKK